jgi:aldehyde:ferredoxin oxidoreductase
MNGFNNTNGFTAAADMLPERFFAEPGPSGEGIEITPLDRQRFAEVLQNYCRNRTLASAGTFIVRDFLSSLK